MSNNISEYFCLDGNSNFLLLMKIIWNVHLNYYLKEFNDIFKWAAAQLKASLG